MEAWHNGQQLQELQESAVVKPLSLEERWAKMGDSRWRLNNLFMIERKSGPPCLFQENWAQRKLFDEMQVGGNIILKARQMGMSTFICLQIANAMWFLPNFRAGTVDKTLDDAKEKLGKIRFAWENLDNPAMPNADIGKIIKEQLKLEKDREDYLVWSNGSSIRVGTDLRGGTVNIVHISEMGAIAIEDPKKATKIRSGTLNAISSGQYVFLESTHEGGKVGLHYRLLKKAQETAPEELTPMKLKFHFFAWHQDASYVANADRVRIRPEMATYFAALEKEDGIVLSPEQRAWYDQKEEEQEEDMKKEYPSTPEEAYEVNAELAIYGKRMSALRAKGRICDFDCSPEAPLIAGWDVGHSDYTSIWLVQFAGQEIRWLDWYENNREDPSHYVDQISKWQAKHERVVARHFLPHDTGYKGVTGKPYVAVLKEHGLGNLVVLPRTADVWLGINKLREMLASSWFHKSNCGEPRWKDGKDFPSGIQCLEGYHKEQPGSGGKLKEEPVHDGFSHSCDAARTIAEACLLGKIGKSTGADIGAGGYSGEHAVSTRPRVRLCGSRHRHAGRR